MKLTTTARHFESSTELNEHIDERLRRLKRFFDHILHVDVIMSVEKFRHIAEVNVHVNGHDFAAKEVSEDMFTSIDMAAKSLERQIKKFKGKRIDQHQNPRRNARALKSAEKIVKAGSVGSPGGINIMEHVPHEVAELSVEEAIIAMEDQDRDFLLFNNPESGKLNFVYRRSDGHYGVIDSLD
ncbi:MAG: ribosome-associated translation inhibitor RaiA [Candidatus Krumholzibacteria bacterium]|nr:ribosome-associated translation inhibitor RaiA [Candidatus Krumholzibacteria bacterium]